MGWNEVPAEGSSGSGSQIPYLKIDREIRVRVIGEPEVYAKHFLRIGGKGVTVKCPGRDSCLICQRGKQEESAKVRAMFVVLDRYDDQLKLYDAPRSVATYIKALMSNPEWGPLDGYDIIIKKIGGKRVDYQVQPAPKSLLDPNVVNYINATFGTINLKQLTRPHTGDEILAILNGQPASSVRQGNTAPPVTAQTFTQAQPVAPAPAYVPPPIVPQAPVAPVQAVQPVISTPVQPIIAQQPNAGGVVNPATAPVQPVQPVQPQGPLGAKTDKFFNQFGG